MVKRKTLLNKKKRGEYFGKYLETWIKLFQKNNDLEVDGCIGKKTLAKLREYGMDA